MIRAKKLRNENGEEFIEINVVDNGTGITEENQSKLFQLFGYLQEGSKHNGNGIGLGLYITKMITKVFDGTVSVKSKVGEGSTFGLTFKLSSVESVSLVLSRELNPRPQWSQQKFMVNIARRIEHVHVQLNQPRRPVCLGLIEPPRVYSSSHVHLDSAQNLNLSEESE